MLRQSLFAVPLLLVSSMASAGTMITSGSVEFQETDFNSVPVFPDLARFDTNLGTLSSVLVEFFGEATSEVTTVNTSNEEGWFRSTSDFVFSLGSADSDVGALLGALAFSGATSTGALLNITAGATHDFGVLNFSGGSSATFSAPDELSAFEGPGVLEIGVSTFALVSNSNINGNFDTQVVSNAGGTVKITYTYDAPPVVPEPSSVIMLGLAGGLVGAVLRFRKPRA